MQEGSVFVRAQLQITEFSLAILRRNGFYTRNKELTKIPRRPGGGGFQQNFQESHPRTIPQNWPTETVAASAMIKLVMKEVTSTNAGSCHHIYPNLHQQEMPLTCLSIATMLGSGPCGVCQSLNISPHCAGQQQWSAASILVFTSSI